MLNKVHIFFNRLNKCKFKVLLKSIIHKILYRIKLNIRREEEGIYLTYCIIIFILLTYP